MGSPTSFGLEDEAIDDCTHLVAPLGEVDIFTAPKLGRRLLGLAEEGKTTLVVDLSAVTFMDSTGISVLLNAVRDLTHRRGGLLLICPTERALRPFEVTGLVAHLRIFRSREEALGGASAA